MERLSAVRGAVTAENTKESIQSQTVRVVKEIIEANNLKLEDFVTIQFSLTKDLDVLNPATALRLGKDDLPYDLSSVPLFCTQEAYIQGGLEKVIRVLITGYFGEQKSLKFAYLDGAKVLRTDLVK
ncbi:chorismate mutase [Treponema sp.]|uniref:chorismate mutase n=1 Tax=Treponema sp. TaxID=166 RepID=UPI00298D6482|nr:chorismate mutase [Treponema sp.]